jgi:hypothetical protein
MMKRNNQGEQKMNKTIIAGVREILSQNTMARDDDWRLIESYLRARGIKFYIDWKALREKRIPQAESITRARRVIQNEERKHLASPKVQIQRLKHEEYMRSGGWDREPEEAKSKGISFRSLADRGIRGGNLAW